MWYILVLLVIIGSAHYEKKSRIQEAVADIIGVKMQTSRPPVTTAVLGQSDLISEVIESFPKCGKLLDVGTGSGLAARRFAAAGWEVTATGFDMEAYLGNSPMDSAIKVVPDLDICDARDFPDASFDAIWCAHVLEHISDTGRALSEIRRLLKAEGWLFVAVPPYKSQIVGGHVNSGWNVGSLMYVLADAGFALAGGRFIKHGYNIFGMVQRGLGKLPQGDMRRANGDIEALVKAGRFPSGFKARQGFEGSRRSVNWLWNSPPHEIRVPRKDLAMPPPIASMRLGFFVPWITSGRGGTENVGQMMANAMAQRGHIVTIFTFDDSNRASRWPLDPRISLIHLTEASDEPADHLMAIAVAGQNLDLLIGLHMNRTMLRYVRCAHRVGLPIILSEHIDPRFPQWIGTFSSDERDVAMAGASLIHMLVDDFIETLDPSERGKARVVPNTVPEPAVLSEPGIEKDKYKILAVARLVPRKNMLRVIEAFGRLARDFPTWNLQIVGDGQLRAHLEHQVKSLGLSERVDFAGEQSNVYPFYAGADIFVIPSLFEGFPLTLCEAIAHGLPAVGFSTCGGTKAQIIHQKTGLLCPGIDEAAELEEALRRLMQNRDERARMGLAAQQLFAECFSNAAVHTAWEALFAEAAQMRRALKQPSHAAQMAVRLWDHVWGAARKGPTV